jgi:hypothetical protein
MQTRIVEIKEKTKHAHQKKPRPVIMFGIVRPFHHHHTTTLPTDGEQPTSFRPFITSLPCTLHSPPDSLHTQATLHIPIPPLHPLHRRHPLRINIIFTCTKQQIVLRREDPLGWVGRGGGCDCSQFVAWNGGDYGENE